MKKEFIDTESIEDVLRSLIEEHGKDLYKKENTFRLKSFLSDFAVKFPKERKFLNVVLDEGIQEKLLSIDNGTNNEKHYVAVSCRIRLTEDIGLAENRATEAVNILALGLGWETPLSQYVVDQKQDLSETSTIEVSDSLGETSPLEKKDDKYDVQNAYLEKQTVLSPIGGTIFRYLVKEGSDVSPDTKILTVISMGVEFEIEAGYSGKVHFITPICSRINNGQPIARIEKLNLFDENLITKSAAKPIIPKTFGNTSQTNNQWQNTQQQVQSPQKFTNGKEKLKSFIEWVKIIGGIACSIVLCVGCWWIESLPNKNSATQETASYSLETKKTVQTEKSNSSDTKKEFVTTLTALPNEKFSVVKYVHTNGLNARTGPDINYNIMFTLSQDSLVYVSDISKNGVWVKIKYNNKIGWVNGSFLRDFVIKSFKIGNHNGIDKWISYPDTELYASKINRLRIIFDVETVNNYNETTKFYIKMVTPENKYIQEKNVHPGFVKEVEGKLESGSYWIDVENVVPSYYAKHPGTWLIQMYYKNPINSNTMDCIGSKYIELK